MSDLSLQHLRVDFFTVWFLVMRVRVTTMYCSCNANTFITTGGKLESNSSIVTILYFRNLLQQCAMVSTDSLTQFRRHRRNTEVKTRHIGNNMAPRLTLMTVAAPLDRHNQTCKTDRKQRTKDYLLRNLQRINLIKPHIKRRYIETFLIVKLRRLNREV